MRSAFLRRVFACSPVSLLALSCQPAAIATGTIPSRSIALRMLATRALDQGLQTPGAQLWVALYNGLGGENTARAVVVSPDGSKVFVTGNSFGGILGTANDYATVAYDAGSGAQLWVSRYSGSYDDEASALAVSPDGTKVSVTGGSSGAGGDVEYATVAYDAAGVGQLWVSRYSGRCGRFTSAILPVTTTPRWPMTLGVGPSYGSAATEDLAL